MSNETTISPSFNKCVHANISYPAEVSNVWNVIVADVPNWKKSILVKWEPNPTSYHIDTKYQ
jgi:hypothetical protein